MASHKIHRWIFAAALIAAAWASPAQAGQGGSEGCSDGGGTGNATEMPIISTPITLHLETATSPLYIQVCYSTTSLGSPAPAVAGGRIAIYDIGTNPDPDCVSDSTAVITLSCDRTDANPASVGYRMSITPRFQETTQNIDLGLELGVPGSPACLRGFTVWGPTGQTGPFDIGVC